MKTSNQHTSLCSDTPTWVTCSASSPGATGFQQVGVLSFSPQGSGGAMRPTQYTPEFIRELEQRYREEQVGTTKLDAIYGLPKGTTIQLFRRNSIPRRKPCGRIPRPKVSEQLQQEIVKGYQEGMKQVELAKLYNVSDMLIEKILVRAGVKKQTLKRIAPLQVRSVVQMGKQGVRAPEISRQTDVPLGSVYRVLHQAGIYKHANHTN